MGCEAGGSEAGAPAMTPAKIDAAISALCDLRTIETQIAAAHHDDARIEITLHRLGGYKPAEMPPEVAGDHRVQAAIIESLERKRAGIIADLRNLGVKLRGEDGQTRSLAAALQEA